MVIDVTFFQPSPVPRSSIPCIYLPQVLLHVLFEHAAGYALFAVKEVEEIGMLLPQVGLLSSLLFAVLMDSPGGVEITVCLL